MFYKKLIYICMFYMALMIFSDLLVNKQVSMFIGYTTAATLIFPLWFILNDIIAEVYGYRICKKIIIAGFLTQLFFNLMSYFLIRLPSPVDSNHQEAFDLIVGSLLKIGCSTFVAFILAGFINIYLLTRWKAIFAGKYFWMRSIASSAIGEGIYSFLNVWPILLGTLPSNKIIVIMTWSCLIKIAYTFMLVYPATMIVRYLKIKENLDVFDNLPNARFPIVKLV